MRRQSRPVARAAAFATVAALMAVASLAPAAAEGDFQEIDPDHPVVVATDAAAEGGWTSQTVSTLNGNPGRLEVTAGRDEDNFLLRALLGDEVIQETRVLSVEGPDGEKDGKAYERLGPRHFAITGPDTGFEWGDASLDFGTIFGLVLTLALYSPQAGSFAVAGTDPADATVNENRDGGRTYTLPAEGVQLGRNGQFSAGGSTDGEDPYPGSTTTQVVTVDDADVVTSMSYTTTYNGGDVIGTETTYTYGPVKVEAPPVATVMPERRYADLLTTLTTKRLLGVISKRATKAAAPRQGTWKPTTFAAAVTKIVNKIDEDGDYGIAVGSTAKTVTLTGRDTYNDKPITVTFTVRKGRASRA